MEKLNDVLVKSGLWDEDGVPQELPDEWLKRIGLDDEFILEFVGRFGLIGSTFTLAGMQMGYYLAQYQLVRARELEEEVGI